MPPWPRGKSCPVLAILTLLKERWCFLLVFSMFVSPGVHPAQDERISRTRRWRTICKAKQSQVAWSFDRSFGLQHMEQPLAGRLSIPQIPRATTCPAVCRSTRRPSSGSSPPGPRAFASESETLQAGLKQKEPLISLNSQADELRNRSPETVQAPSRLPKV